ncbi:hypothetical protein OC845_000652 [Tilletia horrida]|nr:hypothetical protein OC845_000652 [Tilletia horrida]
MVPAGSSSAAAVPVPAGVPITSPAAVAYFAAHPRRQQVYFGNYLLLQTLGEGEFGKVKLGVHREWGEEVAVKLIKRDKVAGGEQGPLQVDGQNKDPAKMTKVEREISVLKDVRHPNIVRLYEVIESDRYIGIVLEYASGGELFDHILAHKYLREKDACKLFAQLISGVSYLHQKKIIHRDLKLENLLLDRNRNVIITDFGFANNFEDKRDDLMATSCGSPCYAAPELVVQDGLYAGSAVDVWSCGVILYAMLAGYLPFDDDPQNPDGDNINLLYKYIMATPLTFPEYITQEPRDLLSKMLVPDPILRATLPMVMAHSWLEPYRDLFKFTVDELENAAKEQQSRKRHAYRQQMLAQQQQMNAEKLRLQQQQQQLSMGRSQTSTDPSALLLGAGNVAAGSGTHMTSSMTSSGLPLDTRQQRHQSAMASTTVPSDHHQHSHHSQQQQAFLANDPAAIAAQQQAAYYQHGRDASASSRATQPQRPTTANPLATTAPAMFAATSASSGSYANHNEMEILAAETNRAASRAGWTAEPATATPPQAVAQNNAAVAEVPKQPAGSKPQRHTIQLEYDSRNSPEAKRSANRQPSDAVPPVPKVPRVDPPQVSSGKQQAPFSGVMNDPNAFVLDGKATLVPSAERQIEAEAIGRSAAPAPTSTSTAPAPAGAATARIVGVRSTSIGAGVPVPITEVKTPPTSNAGGATDGSYQTTVPTAVTTPPSRVAQLQDGASPNGGLGGGIGASPGRHRSPSGYSAQESTVASTLSALTPSAVSSNVPAAPATSAAAAAATAAAAAAAAMPPPPPRTQQRPQTAMPVSTASSGLGIASPTPPRSSESRAARHRKGLSTDKFFFTRLLSSNNNNSNNNASERPTTPLRGDSKQNIAQTPDESENMMPPPSTTDVKRRDTVLSSTGKSNGSSGGRRKALSLVVGARNNEQSPASRDREKAKAAVQDKKVKEERRLTARFGRKDPNSQQQQQAAGPPSTPKSQLGASATTAGLPPTSTLSPAGLATPSIQGSIGAPGTSAAGSIRSPALFDSSASTADTSTVGPSSSAAKKVMDWFRKKSLSKGNFNEQPPFDLDRSSLVSGTPSRLGGASDVSVLAGDNGSTPSRVVNGVGRGHEEGTPRLVVTSELPPQTKLPDSMPSSRSTSGTHSQGTHYTSSTTATTVPDSIGSAAAQNITKALQQNTSSTATATNADDDDANTATPRATPSVAQGGVAGSSQVSLARPFTDAILREHLGAVDQSALTSRAPVSVFAEVRKALYEMGIEVRKERDEEFKLECVRRKRPKTLLGATQGLGLSLRTSVFPPSQAEMERSAAKAAASSAGSTAMSSQSTSSQGAVAPPVSPGGGSGNAAADASASSSSGSGIRNFLRRGTISAASPSQKPGNVLPGTQSVLAGAAPASQNASGSVIHDDPNAIPPPLYGEASVDGGQEVRFSVEITRIKNLPGLYSLDIRRMKGNLWAYKFIYHALLDRCQLTGNALPSATRPAAAV